MTPNHLGWQGWQIDLPADWNPARVTGTDRQGSLVIADLERPRLEMTWKTVRSARAVDLSRLATKSRKERLAWDDLTSDELGEGIGSAYRAIDRDGAAIAMLFSEVSRRLVWLRVMPAKGGGGGADSLRALLPADASGRAMVPWCIYGFSWAAPKGFRLVNSVFAPGRIRVEFRYRRKRLVLERWAMTGEIAETRPASVSGGASAFSHNGHEVRLATPGPTRLLGRLWQRSSPVAEWVCPNAQRRYRVSASTSCPAGFLEGAVRSIVCHRQATGLPG